MRLAGRIIIAIGVTVMAAVALYFVFLRNDPQSEAQRTNNHVSSAPAVVVAGSSPMPPVNEMLRG
jgi:flagellar basal body-associated protein FliL